jgi:hypothetical protein
MDIIVRKFFLVAIAFTAVALLLPAAVPAQNSGFWTAIDPNDLKLDDNPKMPGGPAMVLDYWHEINNLHCDETIRITRPICRAPRHSLQHLLAIYSCTRCRSAQKGESPCIVFTV